MKNELQALISGKNPLSHGAIIQAAARYVAAGTAASPMAKSDKRYKTQEAEILKKFIEENNLWVNIVSPENYVSEGAEQKVYLKDNKTVSKLNDCIYYLSWVDYFHSLLLHNYFFADTYYQLDGFFLKEKTLYACISQPYVKATEPTDLVLVKKFMEVNGFHNTRNHDYHNPELGIILEDLHDENVLTENGVLRFIDTVFYLEEYFFTSL